MPQPFSLEDLGEFQSNLPTEYSRAVLENLDRLMAQQEEGLTRGVLERQENLGILKSGETGRRISEDVLGPGIERRRGALLGMVGQGLQEKRQERLIGEERAEARRVREEAYRFRILELSETLRNQKELMNLQASLDGGDPGMDWGQFGLSLGGTLIGAGLGQPGIGYAIGSSLGKGIFGRKTTGEKIPGRYQESSLRGGAGSSAEAGSETGYTSGYSAEND